MKNILVLAWEFPPRIVGGISRHVAELYPELVKLGLTIHLLTVEVEGAATEEDVDGIHIHRLAVESTPHFFDWIRNMNRSMEEKAKALMDAGWNFDLIHAHDWLVAQTAIALKNLYKIPIVATIHATEHGRHNGIHNPEQHYIYDQEFALSFNAWRVIVCTNYMHQEVSRVFKLPADKINVIHNGIRAEKKQLVFDTHAFRERFAADDEKIVYYVGRMTPEKGLSVFLRAAPRVLAEMEDKVKFVFIGSGIIDNLQRQAWDMGIGKSCLFTGFMPDSDLDRFQRIADCAVFPSLYEPFGIVALESFAAGVPVVVSSTGGFPEVVQHQKTGVVTQVNDATSLAEGILFVLKNPVLAEQLTQNAFVDLRERFSWPKLGMQTLQVYEQVLKERQLVAW